MKRNNCWIVRMCRVFYLTVFEWEIMRDSNETPPIPSYIFFAGAAWGCAFYVGVYRALQERYGLDELQKIKWSGNSAGGLVALCGAAGLDWKKAEQVYLSMAKDGINNGVFQKMSIYHDNCMDVVFNDNPQLYKQLNGQLFIGVTYWWQKYELISEWKSNQELRHCMK